MTVRWPKRWLMGSGVLFGIAALWLLAAMTSTRAASHAPRNYYEISRPPMTAWFSRAP